MNNSDSTPDNPNGDSNSSGDLVDQLVEFTLGQLQNGDTVDFEEINRSHPKLQPELESRLETLKQVFELMQQSDSGGVSANSPTFADSSEVFFSVDQGALLKCPHCGAGIQIVSELDEVTCRNCGSSVQLTPVNRGSATSTFSQQLKKLGRFRLQEVVGRGGFGVVYRAFDTELDRTVAIKLPRGGTFLTAEDEQRFLREARHVARLIHPNIVPVYEIGRYEGSPFIVSEFIDGMTLSDLIHHRRIDFSESAALMAKVADAVNYAHSQKVIHRDLKPANILLNHDLVPYVTDFGLARSDAGEFTITLDGQVLGTPSYMSPEQVSGSSAKVGPLSDIYALGVIFYRMLTGELPFRGGKRLLMHQIKHEEPRSPRTLNEFIPRDMETIALKAMAKEPGKRYASSGELARDLRNAIEGKPIIARPVSRMEKFWRICRRYPVASSLACVLVVLLLATAIGGTVWGVRENRYSSRIEQQKSLAEFANARTLVSKGNDLILGGDNVGALPWLAEAWDVESGRTERETNHRIRIGTVLSQCPWLVSVKAGTVPIIQSVLSPDNRLAASGYRNGRVIVWDVKQDVVLFEETALNDITCIVFSHDCRHFAASSSEGTIAVWNVDSGELIAKNNNHSKRIYQLRFDRSDTRILSGSADESARLWNFQTNEPELVLRHRLPVSQVIFLTNDRLATVESEVDNQQSTLFIWETRDDKEPWASYTYPQQLIDLSFDEASNRLLGHLRDGRILVWDTGLEKPGEARVVEGFEEVIKVQFDTSENPDGPTLLVATKDGAVRQVSLANGETKAELLTGTTINAFAFDPKHRYCAVADNVNRVFVWSLDSQATVCSEMWHSNKVSDLQFTENGHYLLTSSQDGFCKIWDFNPQNGSTATISGTNHFHGALSHSGDLVAVSHSDDHKRLVIIATAGGNTVCEVDLPYPAGDINFSPNDSEVVVACTSGNAMIVDVKSGRLLDDIFSTGEQLTHVVFTPDGKRVIAAEGRDLYQGLRPQLEYPNAINVVVWDRETGREIARWPHNNLVSKIVFSPDGQYVAITCNDKSARVFDLNTNTQVSDLLHKGEGYVEDCAFSGDSKTLLTVCESVQVATIWNFMTSLPVRDPLVHFAKPVRARFYPKTNNPVTATQDGRVHFWNRDGTISKTIETFGTRFGQIEFGNQNELFLTNTNDPPRSQHDGKRGNGAIQLWDLTTFEMVGPLFSSVDPIDKTFFNPHGRYIAGSSETSGLVTIWRINTDSRHIDVVKDLCHALSGYEIRDQSGFTPIPANQFMKLWNRLKNQHPETRPSSYSPVTERH